MSRFRRSAAGTTYFFTLVAPHRRPVLCEPDVVQATCDAILAVRRRWPFVIDAWVQLPDHLHCIWTQPEGDTDFSQRWREIKQHISSACRNQTSRAPQSPGMQERDESAICQRRFWWHRIGDEGDFEQHVDYIHINPVKHGHATNARSWQHSSFRRYVLEGVYPVDWDGPDVMPESRWE